MTSGNMYMPLRQIGILMALDAGGSILNTVRLWAGTLLEWSGFAGAALASDAVNAAGIYLSWTIHILRLLVWALMLAALPLLAGLRKSFRKAKLWYLLRILALITEALPPAVVLYRNPDLTSAPNWLSLVVSALLISAVSILIGESFLVPMGNRTILCAGAELMESFGLEDRAQKNRRCGNRLLGVSLAFFLLLSLAAAVAAWAALGKGVSLYGAETDGVFPALVLPAAVLLCFPAWLMSLAYRFLAAVRMCRTYRAIEELTR